jgi:hypothetical protein
MEPMSASHDCCESDCVCPMSACSTFIFIQTVSDITVVPTTQSLQIGHNPERPTSTSLVLFKPPIYA